MKLWLITQNINSGYDTHDSAIVAAENAEAAQATNPGGAWPKGYSFTTWAYDPSQVTATLIGEAIDGTAPGVILASFNAG